MKTITHILLSISLLLLVASCEKEIIPDSTLLAPNLTTNDAEIIGATAIISVIPAEEAQYSKLGICLSTSENMVPCTTYNIYDPEASFYDVTTNRFIFTALDEETTYYYATYIQKRGSILYGNVKSFTTLRTGIFSKKDLIGFRNARNAGENTYLYETKGVINLYTDIDLSDIEHWEPISEIKEGETFKGNGHTISNMKINRNNASNYYGFIGMNSGTITDLHIGEGSRITIRSEEPAYCGGICGAGSHDCYISQCSSRAAITGIGASVYTSGITAALISKSILQLLDIRECINYGRLTGTNVAGISYTASSVSNCQNFGEIQTDPETGEDAANISGISHSCIDIENSQNNANLTGGHYLQGICYTAFSVSNCTNNANLTGGHYLQGICHTAPTVSNCTNNGNLTKGDSISGICHTTIAVSNCENKGELTGTGKQSSCIAGIVNSAYRVTDCTNYKDLKEAESIGGITNINMENAYLTDDAFAYTQITNCHNKGNISQSTYVGGIIAHCQYQYVDIISCTNSGAINGVASYTGGIIGSTGKNVQITLQDNTNGGSVNGQPGSEENAVGGTLPD